MHKSSPPHPQSRVGREGRRVRIASTGTGPLAAQVRTISPPVYPNNVPSKVQTMLTFFFRKKLSIEQLLETYHVVAFMLIFSWLFEDLCVHVLVYWRTISSFALLNMCLCSRHTFCGLAKDLWLSVRLIIRVGAMLSYSRHA